MDIYEFSIKNKADYETLRKCVSEHLALNVNSVFPEDEFWDRIGDDPIAIGLAVEFTETGFRTFAKLFMQSCIAENSLVLFASKLAKQFNCDVAIGDFTDECEQASERFLVISREGAVGKATAFEDANSFNVAVESGVESIEAFLDRVD